MSPSLLKVKKDKMLIDSCTGHLVKAPKRYTNRVMVGIPVTGLVRVEWVLGRYGQVIPCNWSQIDCLHFFESWSPIGWQVADGRNIISNAAVRENFEWLFFIDHDVILPRTTLIKWNERMLRKDVPVWCGLYFTKSVPSEPLLYRGRGTSYFNKWKLGDEVWVDGIPMGCTVIHVSILKALYEESEDYETGGQKLKRIFETPARSFWDPDTGSWLNNTGTEDLEWCSRVIEHDIFKKAGWPEFQKKKYPFLIDTEVFCRHIDAEGVQYPSQGEEGEFAKKKSRK